MSKPPSERIKIYRLKQSELGRRLKHFYLTEEEHQEIKLKIKELRGEEVD